MTQTQWKTGGGAAAGRPALATDSPGPIGRWEPIALAAEGYWSRIYRARPLGSPASAGAAYALKAIRPERDGKLARTLLAREALVGGSVSNPHLVAVLESGVSRRTPFLVMPWLEGRTLQARLAEGEAIDLPEAFGIVRQAAEAVAALDDGGWIHGDVKPSNILVSAEGHATLLDLGLARRRGESGEMIDRSVMGALHYLPPECLASAAAADVRSDIYSLGAALFQILAGRLPLEADTPAELVRCTGRRRRPTCRSWFPRFPGTRPRWFAACWPRTRSAARNRPANSSVR